MSSSLSHVILSYVLSISVLHHSPLAVLFVLFFLLVLLLVFVFLCVFFGHSEGRLHSLLGVLYEPVKLSSCSIFNYLSFSLCVFGYSMTVVCLYISLSSSSLLLWNCIWAHPSSLISTLVLFALGSRFLVSIPASSYFISLVFTLHVLPLVIASKTKRRRRMWKGEENSKGKYVHCRPNTKLKTHPFPTLFIFIQFKSSGFLLHSPFFQQLLLAKQ